MKTTHLKTRTFRFQDDGTIPNHPELPVILYPGALRGQELKTEEVFHQHNWRNSWIGGVFPYHHYHSNTHEVLAVISGSVKLLIGGEKGIVLTASAGDVIVLPAGTGHKKLASSSHFQIAGAYPDGMPYNILTGKPDERPQALQDIASVPLPDQDPVFGDSGPVHRYWIKTESRNNLV